MVGLSEPVCRITLASMDWRRIVLSLKQMRLDNFRVMETEAWGKADPDRLEEQMGGIPAMSANVIGIVMFSSRIDRILALLLQYGDNEDRELARSLIETNRRYGEFDESALDEL